MSACPLSFRYFQFPHQGVGTVGLFIRLSLPSACTCPSSSCLCQSVSQALVPIGMSIRMLLLLACLSNSCASRLVHLAPFTVDRSIMSLFLSAYLSSCCSCPPVNKLSLLSTCQLSCCYYWPVHQSIFLIGGTSQLVIVRYHCGGWSEEVNSCILIISYMVYL
jgi:hypothetical protein